MIKEIFKYEELKDAQSVVLVFYTPKCSPCQVLLNEAEQIEPTGFEILKVNAEKANDLVYKFSIWVVPTLIVLKNGKEVGRMLGARSKTELEELILTKL
ncbi:thioredoxin family protein [Effusibacillus consociatus]|uniref:Thioredoxin family protein n=1 Tax=Effusibacillus consociatus TaxID=1117041 RepID=A0ABV9Q290_9BACL